MQRALTDFGADAFAQAAAKFKEHDGVEVSVAQVRGTTLTHAARMVAQTPAPSRALPGQGVDVRLAEADGCMMPTVSMLDAPPGADHRKYRRVEWKEIRLVVARDHGAARAYFAATMNGVEAAGDLWENVARAAGRGLQTRVHGVGDGAHWIAAQCLRRFGPIVGYLLDLSCLRLSGPRLAGGSSNRADLSRPPQIRKAGPSAGRSAPTTRTARRAR